MQHEPLAKRRCAADEFTPAEHAYMQLALAAAREAMPAGEVPVGCVFVCGDKVVASGRNRTNETHNATRHAELEALDALIASCGGDATAAMAILRESTLYVTVEPCIMCAAALRIMQLRDTVFGCRNDRFGGCGTVEAVHEHPAVVPPTAREEAAEERNSLGMVCDELVTDDCGIPFAARGGLLGDEAVQLLKDFYEQENPNAPVPRPKHAQKK